MAGPAYLPNQYWSDDGIHYLRLRTRVLETWNDPEVRNVCIALNAYDPNVFRGQPEQHRRRAETLIRFLRGLQSKTSPTNNIKHQTAVDQLISYFGRVREQPDGPGEAVAAVAAAPPPLELVPNILEKPLPPPPDWWTLDGMRHLSELHDELRLVVNFYSGLLQGGPDWVPVYLPRIKLLSGGVAQFRRTRDTLPPDQRALLADKFLEILNGWVQERIPRRVVEGLRQFFEKVRQHPARPEPPSPSPVPAWHGQGHAWQSDTWLWGQTSEIEKALRSRLYPVREELMAQKLKRAIDHIRQNYLYKELGRQSEHPVYRQKVARDVLAILTELRYELEEYPHFREVTGPAVGRMITFFEQLRDSPTQPRRR